jgi:hypothetical protein
VDGRCPRALLCVFLLNAGGFDRGAGFYLRNKAEVANSSPTLLAVAGQTSLWLWGELGQERREYVSASTEQHPMNAAARV